MRRLALSLVCTVLLVVAMPRAAVADGHSYPRSVMQVPASLTGDRNEVAPPNSIVLIAGAAGKESAYGCGVIVAEQRGSITIVTAAHNLDIERAEILTTGGERLRVRTTTVIAGHDLALLEADRPRRAFAVARVAPDAAVGDRVHLWGPIADRPFSSHDGAVRAIDPRVTNAPEGAFAIDCSACDHGDSGTGIFDDRGRLLGIVTAAYSEQRRRLFVLAERARPDGWKVEQAAIAP